MPRGGRGARPLPRQQPVDYLPLDERREYPLLAGLIDEPEEPDDRVEQVSVHAVDAYRLCAGVAFPCLSAGAQPRPSQAAIGDFAPKLAELTDDVLYADVWERLQLSKRDRSLVTVSALIAMNRPDQLRSHLIRARENGVTQDELVETITHLAFYAGWPNAVTAIAVAGEVFEKK